MVVVKIAFILSFTYGLMMATCSGRNVSLICRHLKTCMVTSVQWRGHNRDTKTTVQISASVKPVSSNEAGTPTGVVFRVVFLNRYAW